MGFDNHMANMHTKKSPGWGVIGIQNYRACRPVLGNENAVLNNCDVCGLVYDNVRKLEVHEESTLELDKVEIMKNDKKLLIRHRNREWGAKHPVINTIEMLKWAHSNKDDSDSTTTVSDDSNATETEI